jgi:metal-responsive CopG/Arc/MetJ family transcriptional regulator
VSSTSKISISLPEALLTAAERERRASGESRSEFFRRAVEELLQREREKDRIARYVAGYVAEPEAPYEVEETDQVSRNTLDWDPWP